MILNRFMILISAFIGGRAKEDKPKKRKFENYCSQIHYEQNNEKVIYGLRIKDK